MRFIEPHQIHVKYHQYRLNPQREFTKPVKVALVADMHVGYFQDMNANSKPLSKN